MTTPKNGLPEWAAAQATPWDTINEALFDIDQLMQITVLNMSLTAPPGGESEADAYIVGPTASGAWVGQENNFAYIINGAYRFKILPIGSLVFNQNDGEIYIWNGSAFSILNSGGGAGNYFFPKNVTDTSDFPTEVTTGTETGGVQYNPSRGLTISTNGIGTGFLFTSKACRSTRKRTNRIYCKNYSYNIRYDHVSRRRILFAQFNKFAPSFLWVRASFIK